MNIKLVGRVIDTWKGDNPKYPDTRVTLTDLTNGPHSTGQVKLQVPPALASLFGADAKVSVSGDVVCRVFNGQLGIALASDAKVEAVK